MKYKIFKISILFFFSFVFVSCSELLALADVHVHACYFCGKDKICKKYTTFWGKEIYYCEDCENQLATL